MGDEETVERQGGDENQRQNATDQHVNRPPIGCTGHRQGLEAILRRRSMVKTAPERESEGA